MRQLPVWTRSEERLGEGIVTGAETRRPESSGMNLELLGEESVAASWRLFPSWNTGNPGGRGLRLQPWVPGSARVAGAPDVRVAAAGAGSSASAEAECLAFPEAAF